MNERISSITGVLTALCIFALIGFIAWLIIQAVMKKNKKIPLISIGADCALIVIFMVIGSTAYSKTDDYQEYLAQKAMEKSEQEEIEKQERIEAEQKAKEEQEKLESQQREKEERESKEEKEETDQNINKSEEHEKKEEENKKEDEESENNIKDGIERITSGEYVFITNEDLNKYCANMEGAKIYVIVEIDDMKEGTIQSNLSDGYMMSNFLVGENYDKYKSKLKDGDIVGISGTVAGNDGYGFMGKSVNVEDCLVFAVGEEAEEYRKESSGEGLSGYLVATEEVADFGEELSEEEYKALCKQLDYEDILRNPGNNKGKYCIVEGTVEQIIEGWLGTFTIYVTDNNGNKWGCVYSYKEGESRFLEGDSVIVYGKCEGTESTETVLGKQVTLPRVDVEYIN